MSWEKRNPMMALAMLIGGDTVYKDMLRVAFGMEKFNNTLFLFETKKPNVDLSRNILTAMALKEKVEYIFFLDSDVIPPLNVIPRLVSHNLPIVTGLYWRRYDKLEPCIYKLDEKGIPVPFTDDEVTRFGGAGVGEIEAAGAGCILIHSSVFEKMMPNVEAFDIHEPGTGKVLCCHKWWEAIIKNNVNLSEDIVLASRVRGMGFKIFVDVSIQCGHLTNTMVFKGALQQTPLSSGKDV